MKIVLKTKDPSKNGTLALTQSFSGLIAFSNAYNWHMERSSLLFTGDNLAKREIKKIINGLIL